MMGKMAKANALLIKRYGISSPSKYMLNFDVVVRPSKVLNILLAQTKQSSQKSSNNSIIMLLSDRKVECVT